MEKNAKIMSVSEGFTVGMRMMSDDQVPKDHPELAQARVPKYIPEGTKIEFKNGTYTVTTVGDEQDKERPEGIPLVESGDSFEANPEFLFSVTRE